MGYADHATEFIGSGETSGVGERLTISPRECLMCKSFVKATCGNCSQAIDISERPKSCTSDSCGQIWSCIVVTIGAPEVIDPWLPIYSESAVKYTSRNREDQTEAWTRHYRERLGGSALPQDVSNLPPL